jgi:hypothetical protein
MTDATPGRDSNGDVPTDDRVESSERLTWTLGVMMGAGGAVLLDASPWAVNGVGVVLLTWALAPKVRERLTRGEQA